MRVRIYDVTETKYKCNINDYYVGPGLICKTKHINYAESMQ